MTGSLLLFEAKVILPSNCPHLNITLARPRATLKNASRSATRSVEVVGTRGGAGQGRAGQTTLEVLYDLIFFAAFSLITDLTLLL